MQKANTLRIAVAALAAVLFAGCHAGPTEAVRPTGWESQPNSGVTMGGGARGDTTSTGQETEDDGGVTMGGGA
jgi:hypothetical protein